MPDIITRALLESKGIPTRDIVAAIWGRKLSGGYEPAKVTGTLPLTFRSNGTALVDYRIYGNTVDGEGVGVQTENLFDPNAAEISGNSMTSDFMPLDTSEQVLTIGFDIPLRASYSYDVTYYDSTKTAISFVGGMGEAYKTRETVKLNRQSEAPNAAYVKVTLPKDLTNVLIQNGSTDGAYIPYGYKLPMVSRSGTRRTETPIYIGDTQLMQDEYVSYGEQAIYKRTKNLWNGEWSSKTFEIQPNTAYAVGKYPPLGVQKGWITLTVYNDSMNKLWSDYAFAWISASCPANLSTAKYAIVTVVSPSDNFFFGEATYFDATRYIPYLEPTFPPVPLPELPTFSDTNTVLDYEQTPTPEEVWVKYKKGD